MHYCDALASSSRRIVAFDGNSAVLRDAKTMQQISVVNHKVDRHYGSSEVAIGGVVANEVICLLLDDLAEFSVVQEGGYSRKVVLAE